MLLNIPTGVIFSLSFLGVSHIYQIKNKEQEALEENASKRGFLLDRDNRYGHVDKMAGPSAMGISGLQFAQGEIFNLFTGTGHVLRSSSHYVMRADYLPRGKNVFDRSKEFVGRAKDKLVDLVEDGGEGELAPAFGYEKE